MVYTPKHQINKYVYKCTRCGKMPVPGDNFQSKDLLLAKKVYFFQMGHSGKAVRTRTVEWLCPACIEQDPDWNAPEYPERRFIKDITDPEEYLMLTDPTFAHEQGDPGAEPSYRAPGL